MTSVDSRRVGLVAKRAVDCCLASLNADIETSGRNADAFIVARARAIGGMVVTMERLKPNAVKVRNICDHFKIPYLEGFMESEGWEF